MKPHTFHHTAQLERSWACFLCLPTSDMENVCWLRVLFCRLMCLVTLSDVTCPHCSPETGFGKGGGGGDRGGAGIQSSPIPPSHCSAKQKGNKTLEWKRSIKCQRNLSAIQVVGRDGNWSFIFVRFFNYYFGFFVVFVCLGFFRKLGICSFFFFPFYRPSWQSIKTQLYLYIYLYISSFRRLVCKCCSILLSELIVCHRNCGCMCEVPPNSGLQSHHVWGAANYGGSHAGEWGWGGAQRTPRGVRVVTWSFSSLPGLCTAFSALARLFPLAWETGWASQVTHVEESTTEEHVFGEQCFVSSVLPCFPWPLPLPEEGGPVRQWLPAALLPSPPEVLEAKGTSRGWALPRRGGRLPQEKPLGRRLFPAWGERSGRKAGGGRGGSQSWAVSAWSGAFVAKRKELDCGEERRRSLHPSQGWREVIRQVQCGGLSCRPAVSCGFHGN